MNSALELQVPQEERHSLLYRILVQGSSLPRHRRLRLYQTILALGLLLLWSPVITFLLLKPVTYTSAWTLILPSAGSGHAVSLADVGQANATTNSPYSNAKIDPLVNYQAIATSKPVLARAAASVQLTPGQFGKPRIKLINQTALMEFQVKGATADQAQAKSLALYQALQDQLEQLRLDERARITQTSLSTLDDFNQKLKLSMQEKLDYQQQNDLISLPQFDQLVTRLEQARARQDEIERDYQAVLARLDALRLSLGLTPHQLGQAVLLRNDPEFQQLLRRQSELAAERSGVEATWGEAHPQLKQIRAASRSLQADLLRRGRQLTGDQRLKGPDLALIGGDRLGPELLNELVRLQAQAQGRGRALAVNQQALNALDLRIQSYTTAAAQLEELTRKHQVATAVFTTALARQDIGKVDHFASYPLLQMLAQPTLPERPDRLHKILALGGGSAATVFMIIALVLLWLRKPWLRQLLKSA